MKATREEINANRAKMIARFVLREFIDGETSTSVEKIAAEFALSVSTVRRLLADSGGAVHGTQVVEVAVPRFEKNFGTRLFPDAKAYHLTPTRGELRRALQKVYRAESVR